MIREKEHKKSCCECAQILKALLTKGLNIQAIKQDVLKVIKSKRHKTAFGLLMYIYIIRK